MLPTLCYSCCRFSLLLIHLPPAPLISPARLLSGFSPFSPGFVAAVAVYASNGFTDAAAVDRGAIHGRKALRMDHLHRVK